MQPLTPTYPTLRPGWDCAPKDIDDNILPSYTSVTYLSKRISDLKRSMKNRSKFNLISLLIRKCRFHWHLRVKIILRMAGEGLLAATCDNSPSCFLAVFLVYTWAMLQKLNSGHFYRT